MKTAFFGALALSSVFASLQAQANLIKNGDFSQGKAEFYSDYQFSPTLYAEGAYYVGDNPQLTHSEFEPCRKNGDKPNFMLIVNGHYEANKVIWQQEVAVKPGESYVFEGLVASVVYSSPPVLALYLDDKLQGQPFAVQEGACNWETFSYTWTAAKGQKKVQLRLVNLNLEAGGNDFALDDFVFRVDKPQPQLVKPESGQNARSGDLLEVENLLFETSKSELLPESKRVLDKLAEYLLAQPQIRLDISGHTDQIGQAAANKRLSQERAKAVRDYLIEKGVAPGRLRSQGFGAERPLIPNAQTPEERQKNRRVEFRVL